ncbi:hypothetical protein ACF8C4_07730 [Myroides odoratimimus]|uniref:hypothetical protein n=1 Tax=Myroides odoratimimus TaxID=76832 RepID=UPI00370C2908
MRIIVLQGMPDTGKTSTLNLVYNMLVPNGGGTPTNRQPLGGGPNDFSDIVIRSNQRIAFYTMGDYSTYLANAIYDYDRQGCDVLVCALSTNTAKVRANTALNLFSATRINKTIAPNATAKLAINTADAQTIFNLL